jgi:hypothetical protein
VYTKNAGPARYIADFMYIPITNNIGPSRYIAYLHLGGLFANVGPAEYIGLPAPWVEGLLGSICVDQCIHFPHGLQQKNNKKSRDSSKKCLDNNIHAHHRSIPVRAGIDWTIYVVNFDLLTQQSISGLRGLVQIRRSR